MKENRTIWEEITEQTVLRLRNKGNENVEDGEQRGDAQGGTGAEECDRVGCTIGREKRHTLRGAHLQPLRADTLHLRPLHTHVDARPVLLRAPHLARRACHNRHAAFLA